MTLTPSITYLETLRTEVVPIHVHSRQEDVLHLVVPELVRRLVCLDQHLACLQGHLGVLRAVQGGQLPENAGELVCQVDLLAAQLVL
ncbi:hypothetical protein DPMN_049647 [Dreissena polymorpha]|uniref:Uncharacterized protein n=1 Tax=Dreissena polymorpha TaxID=45954 RepID=A0A9D4HKM4_DREPO|nr:hypothetical protein DPMN_049647 [Dreissena polymorpha]